MKLLKGVLSISCTLLLFACFGFVETKEENKQEKVKKEQRGVLEETTVAYFASGCFWCVEAIFESLVGVEEAVSGYAGGFTANPTYKSIGSGKTGHSESVAVYYDSEKISFETLVTVFFGSHDPTTVNGQHPDYGSQYRSIAFYETDEEKEIILNKIKQLNKDLYKGEIVTEVKKLDIFYEAEEYHQDYEKRNPSNSYVQNVSIPRLNRFKKKFPQLLKSSEH
jgi:peptide-methionine (S)-S-oxide reductase